MRLLDSRGRNYSTKTWRLTYAAALAFLTACGNSGTGDSTTSTSPAIAVAVSQSAVTTTAANPATMNITITRSSGYASDVALGADGLPPGVTASFNPQVLTGTNTSAVVTFTVAANAVAGSNLVTIRATGPGVNATTTTTQVSVGVSAINITTGSASISTAQSIAATVPITIERVGGFTGQVSLTAEGLPENVTASFAPAALPNGTTASTLTLTPSATAVQGTSTITIRATGSGVVDKTTTIQFTVTSGTTADYSLTAAPAALSVVAGAGGSSVITVNRTGSFVANVSLALSGNPTGVTGTFTPNPSTGSTSTLAITTTAATVPGTYSLVVTGTAGATTHTTTVALTVTAVAGVTVGVTPSALSVAAGTTGQTAVTVGRSGGLTGDIVLTGESLPSGVTVAFAPATVSGTSSTATFTATASATPGTYNVVLRGTLGSVSGTVTVALTVTAAQSILVNVSPTSATVAQGGTAAFTANITRTGGFSGTVNLAITGLPITFTPTISPAAVSGATASISIAVGAAVAAGTYNGLLTASATGVANATTAITLTVTGSGGGGGGSNIVWTFCDPTRVPLYFAIKDGQSGAWTKVTAGANNTYSTSITQSVGGAAYVLQNGATITTYVFLASAAELATDGTAECTNNAGTGKTVNGSVAGLAAGESSNNTLGTVAATGTFAAPTLSWTNVAGGVLDLLAVKTSLNGVTFAQDPSKLILRRGLSPAAGSTIPVLDFSAAESFAPASAVVTVANSNGDLLLISDAFTTTNGLTASITGSGVPTATATRTIYGVPTAQLAAGDLHTLTVSGIAGANSFRSVITYFRDVIARTVTLGAALTTPTVTSTVSSLILRPRAQGAIQAEYNSGFGASFTQTGTNRAISISATKAYFGAASNCDLETPDLSGAGYTTSWGLTPGFATTYNVTGIGAVSAPADGVSYKIAAVTGNVPQSAIHN